MKARPAIFEAVKALGTDVPLDGILKWIADKYPELEIAKASATNYLSAARKKVKEEGGEAPAPAPVVDPDTGAVVAPPGPTVDDIVGSLKTLRNLSNKLGKDNVRKLLESL